LPRGRGGNAKREKLVSAILIGTGRVRKKKAFALMAPVYMSRLPGHGGVKVPRQVAQEGNQGERPCPTNTNSHWLSSFGSGKAEIGCATTCLRSVAGRLLAKKKKKGRSSGRGKNRHSRTPNRR